MNKCPTPAQLQQWLAGTLPDAESRLIGSHVTSCPDVCQRVLASLSGLVDDGPVHAGSHAEHVEKPSPPTEAPVPVPAKAGEQPNAPVLPGYEILGQLGRGGMGVVYKARHRRMDRLVAIKVLPAQLVSDPAAVARFEREVQAAARLHHPNIVTAYDAAEANGVHFFVMEYIEGNDLAALVRRQGPLPVKQAVDCVVQAARGLDYAHRHNVVHRDIKPGNLLYDKEGVLKVLDMGLARLESSLGGELTELTGAGQIMGTIDYMAPEQAVDTHHADARADIYSLGMTLWYLLTGRAAYKHENTVARLLAHRDAPIPGLCDACTAASAELECVFEKMVAKRPEERYQSMVEVIAALEGCETVTRSMEPPSTFVEPGSGSDQRRPSSGVGVAEPVVAEPVLASAVTLHAAELDTNPNALRSLSVPTAASPPPRKRGKRGLLIGAALALFGVMFGVYTITVQSGEGEVVVETEVDGISVDIVRNGEPAKTDWQLKTGADNRWQVRTGKIEVKLPAKLEGEFSVEQDTAKLVRDGKVVVRITRRGKAGAVAATIDKGDRARHNNREVAEWVLKHGGEVEVISVPGSPAARIQSVDELAAAEFQFWSISLEGETARHISENELLTQLQQIDGNALQRFWTSDLPLTDHGLTAFTRIPGLANVKTFSIARAQAVGPDSLLALAQMVSLESLNIDGTRISTSSLRQLKQLPRLNRLWISTKQVDDAWSGLIALRTLKTLTILGDATDEDLRQIGKIPQLRRVILADASEIAPTILAEIERNNPLCRVMLGSFKVAGKDHQRELAQRLAARGARLSAWFSAERLQTEDIEKHQGPVNVTAVTLPRACALDDEDLRLLSCPTEIDTIDAPALLDADRCAAAFAEQRVLARNVSLCDSNLTDVGLNQFVNLPLTRSLDVRRTKVTAAGVEKFRATRPDCKIDWDAPESGAAGTGEKVPSNNRQVAEWLLQHGGAVGVIATPGMPAVEVRTIGELPEGGFQLWMIGMGGEPAQRVSQKELLAQLGHVEGNTLQRLYLNGLPLTDEGVVELSRIRSFVNVMILSIAYSDGVGPTSTLAIAHLPSLETVSVEGTRVR